MADDEIVRHSVADSATLITEPDEVARKEASNALVQAKRVEDVVLDALHGDRPFRLRPSLFLDLNRCAIDGVNSYAGNWRPAGVDIEKSKHQPPGAHLVPELVEDLCEYINSEWENRTGIHLSAYTMWRTNWIHPFADGNGRTSRAMSYIVLCVRDRLFLPGTNTIPEQIVSHRNPYYDALENADAKFEVAGNCEDVVSDLETLLGDMLASQLEEAFKNSTGGA